MKYSIALLEHERRILRMQKEQHERLAADFAERLKRMDVLLQQFLVPARMDHDDPRDRS